MLDNKALHLQNVGSHYVRVCVCVCVLYVIYVCMYMYMYTVHDVVSSHFTHSLTLPRVMSTLLTVNVHLGRSGPR